MGVTILIGVFFAYPQMVQMARSRLFSFFGTSCASCSNVAIENDVLRRRIAISAKTGMAVAPTAHTVDAFVYSRFPFNLHDTVFLSRGAGDGVGAGSTVVVKAAVGGGDAAGGESVLFGVVSSVSTSTASAVTVFDPSWKSEVRIGSAGVQALLVGGLSPRLAFIPKNASVVVGDVIYNTDTRFPFGIAIGQVRSVGAGSDSSFQEADIKFPYDASDIAALSILLP